MAITKQKLSFNIEISNSNIDLTTKTLVPCDIELLPLEDTKPVANAFAYSNYISITNGDGLEFNLDNAPMTTASDSPMQAKAILSSTNTSNRMQTAFINANGIKPVKIFVSGENNTDKSTPTLSVYEMLLYTPKAIANLITINESIAGDFKIRCRARMVDPSGIYAPSDPVDIEIKIVKGKVPNV